MKRIDLNTSFLRAGLFATVVLLAPSIRAQSTMFTYQGKLTEAGNPATGTYDIQFKLFDTPTLGTGLQQGPTLPNPTVQVAAGSFTVQLDFGAAVFDGSARYLEISVRPAGSPNPYTVLDPRTQITSAPYAIQTFNTQQLGGLPDSRYVKTETNGNVAIGTGTPAHRLAVLGGPCWTGDCWGGALELDNASSIAWRANSANVKFGLGRTEAGLFFFRTMSPLGTTTNTPTYDFKMDNAGNLGIGNLGIGTDLSGARLNLLTGSNSYGFLQSNGAVAVGSFVDSTGGWLGTKTDHHLHFFTNDSAPKMTLTRQGTIGMGTDMPQGYIHVVKPSHTNIVLESTTGSGASISYANPTLAWSAGVTNFEAFNGSLYFISNGLSAQHRMTIMPHGNVGINTDNPVRLLDVNGRVRISSIPLEAWNSHVCFNGAGDLLDCNFSSLRAKTNVHAFRAGLDIVRRLRPIGFNWKENGIPGVGLGAEEVAEVAPSLVERNSKGEVAGVKYDRLNMILINAIKELQQQIEKLGTVNANLNARLRALEKSERKRTAQRRGSR